MQAREARNMIEKSRVNNFNVGNEKNMEPVISSAKAA